MDRPKAQKPGTYTKAALAKKAALKVAHQEQLQKAVTLVAAGEGGPGKVAGMVDGCTRSQIATAVMHASAGVPFRAAYEILTKLEMARLVKWCLACAANDNPAKEREVSEQVAKMLQCRRLANRHAQSGRPSCKVVPLTAAEERIALDGGLLSHTWFMGFYARNPACEMKTAHKQEAKRVGKQREDVVERHFNGEFGLTASLKARGIMDENGVILDKRRLLNGDEMPAFLDFVTHNQKAIGEAGTSLQKSGEENRECATVNMAGDLGGFIYGPQYLVARKHMHASYGDCTVPWDDFDDYGELCHDDKIYLLEQRSTYSLVSLTDKGVQTGDSFVDFLNFLRVQIDSRNIALVCAQPSLQSNPLSHAIHEDRDPYVPRPRRSQPAMPRSNCPSCTSATTMARAFTRPCSRSRIPMTLRSSASCSTSRSPIHLNFYRCGIKSIRPRTQRTTRAKTSTRSNTSQSTRAPPNPVACALSFTRARARLASHPRVSHPIHTKGFRLAFR